MDNITLTDIAAVNIHGKRWFRRSAGNTYSAVHIDIALKNGERLIATSNVTSGYGEHYDTMAIAEFNRLTGLDAGNGYLSWYLKTNNIPVFKQVSDVAREKDLV